MSATDPGVEDGIKRAANDVEPDDYDGDYSSNEGTASFGDPSRWWFASTASPLLAGTFGPMASGFNVCALVYKWRVYIPPGGTEEHGIKIEDPQWLVRDCFSVGKPNLRGC